MIFSSLSAAAVEARYYMCSVPVLRAETRAGDADTWQVYFEGMLFAEALELRDAMPVALREWNRRTWASLQARNAFGRAQ